jgi:hypothetical protein
MRPARLCVAVAAAVVAIAVAEPASRVPAAGSTALTEPAAARRQLDLEAMESFRPAYRFWQHVFTLPDGAIAFGSAVDGRLLASFGVGTDWTRHPVWQIGPLAGRPSGPPMPANLARRREEMASRFEPVVGPVVHNPTRGGFVAPNARLYGAFVDEWGAIYERFGVPAEIGLGQAIVESGLNGKIRSEARAVGFCQWLSGNWNRLKRLSPHVIEGHNQTTQAPFCAAYLTILATKYGSFIPALSEHHSGGTNVARTLINGERLGAADIRDRYFLGGEFARDLRKLSPGTFKDVYGTYGPRSFLYAEMVFGNAATVAEIASRHPQASIFAMRAKTALSLAEITRRTGLSADDVRRFNPALVSRVPAGATLYLPKHVPAFGADVAFWRRPAAPAFTAVLLEFLQLGAPLEEWDRPAFDAVLTDFRRRFHATATEEGTVMGTMLAYVLEEGRTSRQAAIIAEYRASDRVRQLFERARTEREAARLRAQTSE